jgi:hypothetical protein
MNGISALIKGNPEGTRAPPPRETQGDFDHLQVKQRLTRSLPGCSPSPGLHPPEMEEMSLFVSHTVFRICCSRWRRLGHSQGQRGGDGDRQPGPGHCGRTVGATAGARGGCIRSTLFAWQDSRVPPTPREHRGAEHSETFIPVPVLGRAGSTREGHHKTCRLQTAHQRHWFTDPEATTGTQEADIRAVLPSGLS